MNERHVKNYMKLKGCRRKIVLDNEEVIVATRHFKDEVDVIMKNRNLL